MKKKSSKHVSCEFDRFGVDTHLCKLRDTLDSTFPSLFVFGRGALDSSLSYSLRWRLGETAPTREACLFLFRLVALRLFCFFFFLSHFRGPSVFFCSCFLVPVCFLWLDFFRAIRTRYDDGSFAFPGVFYDYFVFSASISLGPHYLYLYDEESGRPLGVLMVSLGRKDGFMCRQHTQCRCHC